MTYCTVYATCCGLLHASKTISCSVGMSTATCLGCNGAADPHDRRLLSGPTSTSVLSAWKEIIATKVQADRSLETVAAQVQASANSAYLCRRCFTLFDRYQKTKVLLLANIEAVLSSQPDQHELVGSKRPSAEIDDDSTNPVKVARLTQAHARRQLSFSAASSPPVVVSVFLKKKTLSFSCYLVLMVLYPENTRYVVTLDFCTGFSWVCKTKIYCFNTYMKEVWQTCCSWQQGGYCGRMLEP